MPHVLIVEMRQFHRCNCLFMKYHYRPTFLTFKVEVLGRIYTTSSDSLATVSKQKTEYRFYAAPYWCFTLKDKHDQNKSAQFSKIYYHIIFLSLMWFDRFLCAIATKSNKNTPIRFAKSVCLSVRLFTYNNSRTEQIFTKFDIRELY